MDPETYLIDGEMIDPTIKGTCIVGFQKLPDVLNGQSAILLGDVFIRNFYSVFDIENKAVMLGVNVNNEEHVSIKTLHPVEPKEQEK